MDVPNRPASVTWQASTDFQQTAAHRGKSANFLTTNLTQAHDYIMQVQKAKKMHKYKSGSQLEKRFRSNLHKLCYQVLHHRIFDPAFSVVIILNLVLVVLETDAVAGGEDPPTWVAPMSWLILVGFVLELALRLFVLQLEFWLESWNIVDFVIVLVDVFFNALGLITGSSLSVTFLRIMRLCKLARVSKVMRVFHELRLMMAGLLGSFKAIFWGTVLLVFALLVWAIIAVQFLHPLNQEIAATGAYADCERCSRAYASVAQATLTFCQQIVAGDSWGLISITVIEHYPATAVFYAAVFLSVGMAILNLILGVVVDVAGQARERLRGEIENEKLLEKWEMESHLLEVCKSLDADGNGEITREELFAGYHTNARFRDTLSSIDVEEEDLEILWTILDGDHSGTVSYEEFVANCYKLKSSEVNFMLAYIKYYITVIKIKICQEMEDVKIELGEKVDEELVRGKAIEAGIEFLTHGGQNGGQFSEGGRVSVALGNMDNLQMDGLLEIATSELKEFTTGVKQFGKLLAPATETPKEQAHDKVDNVALGPSLACPEQEHNVYLDLLLASHQQQTELIASVNEIRQKVHMGGNSSLALFQEVGPLLASKPHSAPRDRICMPRSLGCCAERSDSGRAFTLPVPALGAAGHVEPEAVPLQSPMMLVKRS